MSGLKFYSKKRDYPETRLQKVVVQHLRLVGTRGMIFFAIPNGVKMSPRTANLQKSIGMLAGVADLCIVIDGKAFFLELKSSVGKQSPEQIAFEQDCKDAGVPYVMANSIDTALNALRTWGALRIDKRRQQSGQDAARQAA
jgi:hypothetical protein